MLLDLKKYKDNLLFIPLGGANEIGINVNLYHYRGKWIMIDCGSGFADENLPGVDMVVADLNFIYKHRKNLLAMVLTHAHEDHIGAIPFIWNHLQCPIYATNFTAKFLGKRLSEYTIDPGLKMHIMKPEEKINLDPFEISTIPLTHSTTEMQAISVKTDKGTIIHTGDWKFDKDPLIGPVSNEELLREYGKKGVLALVCDSTNVFNEGHSESEGELRKSLVKIVKECPSLVVVTTFASNLARLDTIIYAAKKAGRRVVLTGKSLFRMTEAAKESGYLSDIDEFVDVEDLYRHPRDKILIISTGCQGEQYAGVTKIATGSHNYIKLQPKDTVIFSSKIIPGNERKIFRLFNAFVRMGIEVITEKDHFVHVSGHPCVNELKHMYSLVKPKIAIPVHGEPVHIHEHTKLARSWGVKKAIEVQNGSVVLLDEEEESSRVISNVHSGYLGVDGNFLIPSESPIFQMRKRMRDAGVMVISIVLQRGRLACNPIVSCPGCLDRKSDKDIIQLVQKEIQKIISKINRQRIIMHQLEKTIKLSIRRTLQSKVGKSPPIIVNFAEI